MSDEIVRIFSVSNSKQLKTPWHRDIAGSICCADLVAIFVLCWKRRTYFCNPSYIQAIYGESLFIFTVFYMIYNKQGIFYIIYLVASHCSIAESFFVGDHFIVMTYALNNLNFPW